jgi:hypothetical protein
LYRGFESLPLSKLDFLDCLKAVAERAELNPEDFWLHKFRATFATRCLWAGNHTVLGSVTIPGNTYFVDSGALSINAPAGVPVVVLPLVTPTNCNLGASAGGDVYMNTQYVMQ